MTSPAVARTVVGRLASKRQSFRDTAIDPKVIKFINEHGLGRRRLRRGNKNWRRSTEVAPQDTLRGKSRDYWAGGRGRLSGTWSAQVGDRLHTFGQRLDVPEVALIGRSNVGKSSLLNALLGLGLRLSKVENRPGTTLEVKRFLLPSEKMAVLDLPGYGFAYAGQEPWREAFQFLCDRASSGTLKSILILLDARHGLKKTDIDLLDNLGEHWNFSYEFVLTKSDLVQPNDLARRVQIIKEIALQRKYRANLSWVHLVSSPNYRGIAAMQTKLVELVS